MENFAHSNPEIVWRENYIAISVGDSEVYIKHVF